VKTNHYFLNNHKLIATVLLSIISVALFFNTLNNDFTYDDRQIVENNPFLIGDSGLKELLKEGRVVRTVSLMLDYKLFGLNPHGYHIQNIFWHTLSTILLFFFLLRLSGDQKISFLAAVLFVCHPSHVEAVANISNRKDILSLAFSLISFLLYLKSYETGGKRRSAILVLAVMAFFLASFSKQVAVIIPLMMLAYELYFIPKSKKRLIYDNFVYLLPFSILLGIYGILYSMPAIINFVKKGEYGYAEYLLTTIRSMHFYDSMLLWPVNMSADHVFKFSSHFFEINIQIALFSLITMLYFLIKLRTSMPLISYGILWYLVTLLPVMAIPGTTYFAAERYLYMPSVGFVLVFSVLCATLRNYRGGMVSALLAIVIGLHSVNTINRNMVWKNEVNLWLDTLRKDPDSTTAHATIANIFNEGGMPEKAIPYYLKVLEVATEDHVMNNNIGNAYEKLGRYDEAMKYYRRAQQIKPDSSTTQRCIANLNVKMGKFKEAIQGFQFVLQNDPKNAEVYFDLGLFYENTGDKDKAIEAYEEFVKRWKKDKYYTDIALSRIAKIKETSK
jgi:tetratricopeptide (TPR) repeat protein